nr:retrovirus-related Pol polyprotein from transposon TNT 1-94 [Tanacetum cinerariifolium]
MQSQTSNTLHNAIMEAGGKDHPPMLAPGIDNDIYSTVDACPNACEMWKSIERLKQGNVAGARETVGTMVMQKSGIQCYNCKEFGHVARECQKLKRVKDTAYHKEKMLMCKQEEAGFQLNAEQADWKDDTDDEPEDQELEAHYMYMAQIQEVTPDAADDSRPIFDTEPLQKNDDDDDDLDNERDLLASLIKKLKCEIDDSKNRNNFLETSNKDKGIAISELKKLIEKLKGKSVDTKFEKSSVIRQLNAFKSQTPSILGKPTIFSDPLERKDFSKLKTKMPMTVPVSSREPKRIVNKSVAKPLGKTVASESTNQKPRNTSSKLYEHLVEIILFIVDSGSSKHMTGNLKLLINFVEKFLGTVKFRNDQIVPILGYGDLGNDLLTGSHGLDLYSINLQDTSSPNPICLMAKATSSQAWLWHRYLSRLNFDTINMLSKNDIVIGILKLKFVKDHLCSSCELGKAKRKSFLTKTTPSSKRRLQVLHMDLCGPMRVASINGKKYFLVIVDDYSRYTWTHFLRSKDETPEVLIYFLRLVQRGLHAHVRTVRTDKGMEFLNKTLHAYFATEGINHQMSVARTPEQNDVVKRQNHTLVEAARIILSAAKVPLKPSVKFFYLFGSLCYIVRDGENLNKMKEKGDACIFVGYSTQSRAYRAFNKRIRVIVETIHVNFDELPHMVSNHISFDPVPQCPMTALEHDGLNPGPQCQENDPHAAEIVTTSNELDLLFIPSQAPTVTSAENINQAEKNSKNVQVVDDEFVNIFCTPVQDREETSSLYVDSSNMHTFYQRHPFEHRWTKDHPLAQVIGNPSQSVRTRRQLESRKSTSGGIQFLGGDNEDGNPARANIKQALGRTVPIAKSLASHISSKGISQSGAIKIGASVNILLSV